MDKKVIIRGHVFDYAEKAPFVKSGVSVLGAIEYDGQKVKCHECGEWLFEISGQHLKKHVISTAIYKFRHGLNQKTYLGPPSIKQKRSLSGKRVYEGRADKHKIDFSITRSSGANRPLGFTRQSERVNEIGRCKAQTLFRIQIKASELGRTPTAKELIDIGMNEEMLVKHFGSRKSAMEEAGLVFRKANTGMSASSDCPLPNGFPTRKQLDDTRMPWPKEYFGVNARSLTPLSD